MTLSKVKKIFRAFLFRECSKLWLMVMVFFTCISISTSAQQVTIEGEAREYTGRSVIFYRYQNFINHHPEELFTLTVDEEGRFTTNVQIDAPTYAFAYPGIYKAYIYIQPGESYQLVFPPLQELSAAQKLNPFFQHEEIELGIANNKPYELNRLIRDFDLAFENRFSSHAIELFSSGNPELAQTLIDSLESRFPDRGEWFSLHKKYRYARIFRLAARRNQRLVIDQYFAQNPVNFSLPAYWDAFNELMPGYMNSYLTTTRGNKMAAALADSVSFAGLSQALASDTLFVRADFREAVLISWLYNRFFEKDQANASSLNLMAQAGKMADTPKIREIAAVLFTQLSRLRPGSPAPGFTLYNLKGKPVSLADYQGKFVYLNFMHSQNYACRKALASLQTVAEKFKRELEVVTILIDQEVQVSQTFINTLNPKWDILFVNNNSDVSEKYDIQAVPAYFLINPEGEIALNPAPGPTENFSEAFAAQFLKYRQKQQREKPRKDRSIFDL